MDTAGFFDRPKWTDPAIGGYFVVLEIPERNRSLYKANWEVRAFDANGKSLLISVHKTWESAREAAAEWVRRGATERKP